VLEDKLGHKYNFHSLIGGMTTDYLNIFCKKCGTEIEYLNFYGIDSIGVRLRAKCVKCDEESIFKLKVYPPLGPIEMTDHYDRRGYKLYDGRKLKKYLRNIGHPLGLLKNKCIVRKNIL